VIVDRRTQETNKAGHAACPFWCVCICVPAAAYRR
jgi:hypothetical protein